jgi:uncharacterized phage protein (TIGR01671 family)
MSANRFRFRAWHKTREHFLSDPISFYITEPSGVVNVIYSRNRVIVPAHRVVLMQSTGLLDSNGVEIYEGDIVGIGNKNGEKGVVTWNDEHDPCWMLVLGKNARSWNLGERSKQDCVIGNIYENPELIEV